MMTFLLPYLSIAIFFLLALVVALGALGLSFMLSPKEADAQKLSSYESGFDPFGRPSEQFDIRFYLVAILFIIFDLEVALLFPWAVSLREIGVFGFVSVVVFLVILTIGFVYEWKKGALEWN